LVSKTTQNIQNNADFQGLILNLPEVGNEGGMFMLIFGPWMKEMKIAH